MKRSGLSTVRAFAQDMGEAIDIVVNSPGRAFSSAVQMSQMAPFVDRAVARPIGRTSPTRSSRTTRGAQVIGLGLDLTLRERSDGRVTLDDFMRALWEKYGRPGHARRRATSRRPTRSNDLKSALAAVSGDAAFAEDFFARYIEGREVVDYARLLDRAGFILRPRAAGRAWAGALRTQDTPDAARAWSSTCSFGSRRPIRPASTATTSSCRSADRATATSADIERALTTRKPGDSLQVVYERRGERITSRPQARRGPRPRARARRRSGPDADRRAAQIPRRVARFRRARLLTS